jgi:NTE family protein
VDGGVSEKTLRAMSNGGISGVARRIRDAVTGEAKPLKTLNLALQGGGAHGAFTWGVLDRLLEDQRIDIEAISGTSAGAMNAVVLADGLMRGGIDGARERLDAFWRGVSREGVGGPAQAILEPILSFWNVPTFPKFSVFSGLGSPHLYNPLNINPLHDLLEQLVDFDRVRANEGLRLFVSATNVRDGKIKVFSGHEVTSDAVMASACLPHLFRAVEIDGQAYWDGGYSGNPALFPFFTETHSEDILLVQINPVRRESVPTGGQEIMERLSEITFNASLLREFRAIDFVNRLMDEGRLDSKHYRRNRLHRIDATEALAHHKASSRLDTSLGFFLELRDAGREATEAWLASHYDDIGVKATLDLRSEFM